tara:strand:- start:942 stop:1547 length:606 start_codon:yes stop_codon:yes gene_type:complete
LGKAPKTSKAEQREITTRRLVGIAREAFGERGYASVPTEEIVRLAGVTRGALYHHFRDKRDLFLAVFEDAQREIAERIATEADRASDPWDQLLAGCRAFLEACTDPRLQQIVVIDAPAVLGWDVWRQVDARNGLTQLKLGLSELQDAGVLETHSIDALAHLLSGAMNEAALWVAQSDDQESALEEAMETLATLLQSIRIGP